MSESTLPMRDENTGDEDTAGEKAVEIADEGYKALADDLEQLLMAAQPRLARLAQAQGVTPDGVEDVIQETFVHAWQNLAYLRTPERFEAWLNGICRNVSLRWTRTQGTADRRQQTFSSLQPTQDSSIERSVLDIPDPQMLDLVEDFHRQELAILLDRAMDHLSAVARKALEMHYIADMPQREVALQLGTTINALEVKLHRARRQLRQVLQNELRADAESFGLILDNETANLGWRETSLWCFECGQRHLQGAFEPLPGGEFGLRLRCAACSAATGTEFVNTGGMVSFAESRSFRPAFKQMLQAISPYFAQALATGYQRCIGCERLVRFRGIEAGTSSASVQTRYNIVLECSACGEMTSSIFALYAAHPPVYPFILQHERCIAEPEELIEYQGQPAIRTGLRDLLSTEQLTLVFHRHTLRLLAVFQK